VAGGAGPDGYAGGGAPWCIPSFDGGPEKTGLD